MVETLPDALRQQLDAESVQAVLEYLARRMGLAEGHSALDVQFQEGHYTRGYLKRGPVGRVELEELGRREAAPLPL